MTHTSHLRRLSTTLQRHPWLLTLPYYVHRWLRPHYYVGAVGIVFNPARQFLLVEHVFHPKYPWGLPGGWVDRNENPAETVRRELHEEVALNVQVGPIVLIDQPFTAQLDIAYLCYTEETVGQLSYELLSHQWAQRDQPLPKLSQFHQRVIHKAHQLIEQVEISQWLQQAQDQPEQPGA